MSVRAKFRLNSYTVETHRGRDGEPVEKRTLNFTPVYSSDEGSENRAFWDATPTGSIQLGVVNQEAWKNFERDGEYFVDFTKAE